jgi:hypothetical protein
MTTMGKKHEANLQRDRIIALKAREPNLSTSEIASRFGCAARTVTKVLSDHKRGTLKTPDGVKAYSNPITGQFVMPKKGNPRLPNLQHIAIGFDDEGS